MLKTESKDLIEVSKTLRDAFEKGVEKGRQEAIETMLRRLFVWRLGRPLTEREQHAVSACTRTQTPGDVVDRVFDREGEALARWLLDLNAI